MRCNQLFAAAVLFVAHCSLVSAAQSIRILVHVPAETLATSAVYLAGSLPEVGSWKAGGVKLSRQADGTYSGTIELEIGQTLEFKLTRGSWATVEKNADGSDRANRSVTVSANTKDLEATVDRWASGESVVKSSVVGTLKFHEVESTALKQSRTIRVWLPPSYATDTSARFDVLYMHDGQNCFDRATSAFGSEWEIDESLTKLMAEKRIPPLIVVAIDNGQANRISELTFNTDAKHRGGQGEAYAKFLLAEVKPFIDKTYRTNAGQTHTFIGGSSLGGLAALEIAQRHPGVFGGVIAMSPSLTWASEATVQAIEHDVGGLRAARVWIDVGTRESSRPNAKPEPGDESDRLVELARRVDRAFAVHHVPHQLEIDSEHAEHNESAWARRFPGAIEFILDAK